jgi:hypothetical protein
MEPTRHSEPRRFYGRPADRSLPAYKDFILGMTLALNPAAKDELTEAQWREAWEEFWAAASELPGNHQE